MIEKKILNFQGFFLETLDFLMNLKKNNCKQWFEAHRDDYNEYLLDPFRNLVMDLSEDVLQIDPFMEVAPSINKTISRIHRDVRFSKDKSLYKKNMWITFKRSKKEWRDAPSFFFEISPESYRYGMGYYSATKKSMDIFRQMIDESPKDFNKAISFFQNQNIFEIEGDVYKKTLDSSKPSNIRQWYDRKNIYLVHNSRKVDRLFTREIVDDLIIGFNMLRPIYSYLCKVQERKIKDIG